ncbi:hypothetical protein BGX28_008169 [Mortierella sp. GBA30]|nr:hypothetical protein BGX28_008169 [Mortierella sp. GBA30]
MVAQVVATFCLESTGQTISLNQGDTLFLGRGSFVGITSNHVSRKQGMFQLTANVNNIAVTRLGTNLSLLNGKILPKDQPVPVKNADVLSLLESQFPITIGIEAPELDAGDHNVSVEQSSERSDSLPSCAIGAQGNLISESLRAMKERAKEQDAAFQRRVREQDQHTRLDDDMSEHTSDSGDDGNEEKNASDISAESSLICEDLSDLEDSSHKVMHLE